MSEQLSISLNLLIPEQIQTEIIKTQQLVSSQFSEQRNYDPSAHISLLNKFMSEEDFERFFITTKPYLSKLPPIRVQFSKYDKTKSGKYIFLYFNASTNALLNKIHTDLIEMTRGIGNETWDGKPSSYGYTPHISILKVNPVESDTALDKIRDVILPENFEAKTIEVSKEVKINGKHVGFNKDLLIHLS